MKLSRPVTIEKRASSIQLPPANGFEGTEDVGTLVLPETPTDADVEYSHEVGNAH